VVVVVKAKPAVRHEDDLVLGVCQNDASMHGLSLDACQMSCHEHKCIQGACENLLGGGGRLSQCVCRGCPVIEPMPETRDDMLRRKMPCRYTDRINCIWKCINSGFRGGSCFDNVCKCFQK